jgi:hypothetical protein
MNRITVRKILSPNDVGDTASHQAGMLIPKEKAILDFFPRLDRTEYNPRQSILFEDEAGQRWAFNFIWYNNRTHGRGTRNEYRLTGMTRFLRQAGLSAGDAILFVREGGDYAIKIERAEADQTGASSKRLILTTDWMIVEE